MNRGDAALTIKFSRDLRERARAVCTQLRRSTSQLIRDAFAEKVEFYEEKFRREKALRRADRLEQRGLRNLPRLGERDGSLAPKKPNAPDEDREPEVVSSRPKHLEAIYDEQAKRIAEALDSPTEKRLRVIEALKDIRKRAPLTCPTTDREILEILEERVLRIDEEHEKEFNRHIDHSNIKTSGDFPSTIKEDNQ